MQQFALIGTTASGKTALALQLASSLDAVILSLDSLCVYKEICIASAKPSASELAQIHHFGVDVVSVNEAFSVGEFFKEYQKARKFALENSKNLIITGGSGFYLNAMLKGLAPKVPRADFYPANSDIYELCKQHDKEFADKYSTNDTFRLQKWWDIFEFSGISPSVFLAKNTAEPIIENIDIYELCWDKELLRNRIRIRTSQMLENGLIAEAKELFARFDESLKPLNSIGLKECKDFFAGKIKDEKELKEMIITHTAQLAKRQRTFFNSQFKAKKLDPNKAYEIILNDFKNA